MRTLSSMANIKLHSDNKITKSFAQRRVLVQNVSIISLALPGLAYEPSALLKIP